MTKHWIRTSYVPERYSEIITPDKWYELFDSHDIPSSYSGGSFLNDQQCLIGVFVQESMWLDGASWDYCESDTYPDPDDTNTKVIVPIKDLQAVEEARLKILEFLAEQEDSTVIERLAKITSAFYKVGNTKYPKVD